jgi:tetratricopeptide (TPR) repeat protein
VSADTPRIEELKRRVQSDPASIAFAALAEEYRRAGRFEESIATCTAGLVRHPSYLSAHVTLGRALLEVGRFQDARDELEHVLRLAPENLAAIRGLAEIHQRTGQEIPEEYTAADAARHIADADADAYAHAHAHPHDVHTPPPRGAEVRVTGIPDPGAPPALAGLEVFLLAIQRARSERGGDR